MREAFIDWRPIGRSEYLLNVIERLTKPYVERGIALSATQVFGLLLEDRKVDDSKLAYERVRDLLKNAHLAGRIDWEIGKDLAVSFFGDPGGVEVWVFREDLVTPTLAALSPFHAGVMIVRESPSISSLYEAAKRNPRAVLSLGAPPTPMLEFRLTQLGCDADVFSLDVELPERLSPEEFEKTIRDEVKVYAKPARPLVDRSDLDVVEKIEAAMAEVGDTTRAASLKKRIAAILEEA